MRNRHLLAAAVASLSLALTVSMHATPAQASVAPSLVEGNTEFALSLYGQLKSTPGNLFFSPYSISTCLAMTYAGARGETEKQMAQALHLPDQDKAHAAFGELQRQLSAAAKPEGVQLNQANALWAQQGHPILPGFLNVAKSQYAAGVNQADFRTEAEKTRLQVNQWVAKETQQKIQDLLPPGSVNSATRLILANAIYFKGLWIKPYDKNQTSDQPFHLSTSSQVQAPLMHLLDDVRYTETPEFQAVELPYRGKQLAMVVLLPRQVDGCGQLETQLSPALLRDTLGRMRLQKVDIFLPRFKLESRFKLNENLAALGMCDAFGPQADFSGIDGQRDLFLSAVFHKAWGEVNEEGTEAAAATGAVVALTSVAPRPARPPVFRADHPFLFLIRDTQSGNILFLGRLADPGK